MSQIIKAYLGIIIMLFVAFSASGIFIAFLTVMDAQDLHQNMVTEIENSDFYPEVLRSCFERADENGYELTVTLYKGDYTSVVCNRREEIPENTNDVITARVDLCYPLAVAFYDIKEERRLCAYAR